MKRLTTLFGGKIKILSALIVGIFLFFGGVFLYQKQTEKTMPVLTVAGIVHVCPDNKIALIERGKSPKGIAMFGGHVEAKESPISAFKRELKEELMITQISNLVLVGVHGDYGRDPRQHSVEVTYSCTTDQIPKAASDAKSVIIYNTPDLVSKLKQNPKDFAFDHGEILAKYLKNLGNCNPCHRHCRSKFTK